MDKINSKLTEVKDINEFLTTTGFILEMKVSELLRKRGYITEVNQYFYDYDGGKKREIDIIATKIINEIKIILIIECKQSLVSDWIFICSDRKPKRFYNYVKYTPDTAGDISKTKIFNHMHMFDINIPLAQNYIIKEKYQNKKSTSEQIDECLEKLPKATVYTVYSKQYEKERKIYLPIAVFSEYMFSAQYNKKLKIQKVDWIQYESNLESDNYIDHLDFYPSLGDFPGIVSFDNQLGRESEKNTAISDTSRNIGYNYLIDFTNKKGLSKLISKIESDVSSIDLNKWPIKTTTKE